MPFSQKSSPKDDVELQPTIGIIGMGAMGRMYTNLFSKAVSLIDGVTVHFWGAIPVRNKREEALEDDEDDLTPHIHESWVKGGSAESKKRRQNNIAGRRYLIIDEFSMMNKDLLAKVDKITAEILAKSSIPGAEGGLELPFGGPAFVGSDLA
ncbi:hypothetical protein C8J56DRAFT_1072509 [Mycena floridula]|nr:hypothetical protein C8J56DRAFT_1072509 [Mycena floridula]